MAADFTINVTFDTTHHTFSFAGDSSNGDLNPDISSSKKTIEFKLVSPTTDCQFVGIKINRNSGTPLQQSLGTLSTQGSFYPSTCFKVSSTPNHEALIKTITLEDDDRPNEDDSGAWHYCLGVAYQSNTYWPDPKITNTGGDTHVLPPGLYWGG